VIIGKLIVVIAWSNPFSFGNGQRNVHRCAPGDHPAQPGIGGIVTSSRKVYKSNSWIPDRPDGFFGGPVAMIADDEYLEAFVCLTDGRR